MGPTKHPDIGKLFEFQDRVFRLDSCHGDDVIVAECITPQGNEPTWWTIQINGGPLDLMTVH